MAQEGGLNSSRNPARLGLDLINPCVHLRKFRRPMLWIGGSTDAWSYNSPPWDATCEKAVLAARALGIPTITGERYLTHLELGKDKIHAKHNADNAALFVAMFEDARKAAYAIAPSGSFPEADEGQQLRERAAVAPSTKVWGPIRIVRRPYFGPSALGSRYSQGASAASST